jgi:hypothetical protein
MCPTLQIICKTIFTTFQTPGKPCKCAMAVLCACGIPLRRPLPQLRHMLGEDIHNVFASFQSFVVVCESQYSYQYTRDNHCPTCVPCEPHVMRHIAASEGQDGEGTPQPGRLMGSANRPRPQILKSSGRALTSFRSTSLAWYPRPTRIMIWPQNSGHYNQHW